MVSWCKGREHLPGHWKWVSLSILSATTSAFRSVSLRVLRPRGASVLIQTTAPFDTGSARLHKSFVARPKSATFATADSSESLPLAKAEPVVASALTTSALSSSLDRPRPARVRKWRTDRAGTAFVSSIAEACAGFFESLLPKHNSEPFVVTRRDRQCHHSHCVPIVIMERDHVVIIESGG